jgi:hypothetical protein
LEVPHCHHHHHHQYHHQTLSDSSLTPGIKDHGLWILE